MISFVKWILMVASISILLVGCTTPNKSSSNTSNPAATPQSEPEITWKQFDDLQLSLKFDDVTKQLGAQGKYVGDQNDKKVYEYKIKDKADTYAQLFFSGGEIVDKASFVRAK
ncbi:hypothetical protein [Paenibacillus cremeus]|uniref:Lipoprotein n=1 Tax=Paenibacillus cremeus TaxID=2163881 RepID=A0A559K9F5_9BACL|nr:hypothetical protein [Paenibacillus cremeus]TVY08771.1 hypothetical protein FPZ49_17115 [Paenibacillus cremeus]